MYWMNTGTHVISTKTQTADISLIELQCMARVQDSEDQEGSSMDELTAGNQMKLFLETKNQMSFWGSDSLA